MDIIAHENSYPGIQDRPALNRHIAIKDFQSFYWLKEELVVFCRTYGLKTAGSKSELNQRIAQFLTMDTITPQPAPTSIRRVNPMLRGKHQSHQASLSPQTLITEHYRSDQVHREFFKSVIGPHFHFTTRFMRFFKENVGKTYQDGIDEWYREVTDKKDPAYQTSIAPQFEYNRHIREFMHAHPEKSLQDAITAWKLKKAQRQLPPDEA